MNIDEAVVSVAQQNETWSWRAEDINHEVLEIVESNGSTEHLSRLTSYREQLADTANRLHSVFVMSQGPRFVDILTRT